MCPMCYESYENPEALQEHFDLTHNENNNLSKSPSTASNTSNNNSINTGIENPVV